MLDTRTVAEIPPQVQQHTGFFKVEQIIEHYQESHYRGDLRAMVDERMRVELGKVLARVFDDGRSYRVKVVTTAEEIRLGQVGMLPPLQSATKITWEALVLLTDPAEAQIGEMVVLSAFPTTGLYGHSSGNLIFERSKLGWTRIA